MLEQFSAKGVSMIVSIILARILLPEDYGIIALTTIFTNLSDILIDGGFSTALISKESVDDRDYSAVFSISTSIAVILYGILFFSAPFISSYYSEPQLLWVIRTIGLGFFLQAFTAVRNGIVNRNMQFRLLFVCNTLSSVISGIIGIVAAVVGLGVWALVIQRLSQQLVLNVMLFTKVKWKVRWIFDMERIRGMLSFSMGVVGSSLISFTSESLYSAFIGKQYSVKDLGYYDKGGQLPRQLSLYTFGSLSSVLLPTLSSCQNEPDRFKMIIRKTVKMTSFLIMPLMIGMIFAAREIIVLLFTEKWLMSVPILQIVCIYYLVYPFFLINVQVYFALGKSGIRVKLEMTRLVLMLASIIVCGMGFRVQIVILTLIYSIIMVLIVFASYLFVRGLIGYSFKEVFSDIKRQLIATVAMGAVLFALEMGFTGNHLIIMLVAKVTAGLLVYISASKLLKIDELGEITGLLKSRRKK